MLLHFRRVNYEKIPLRTIYYIVPESFSLRASSIRRRFVFDKLFKNTLELINLAFSSVASLKSRSFSKNIRNRLVPLEEKKKDES